VKLSLVLIMTNAYLGLKTNHHSANSRPSLKLYWMVSNVLSPLGRTRSGGGDYSCFV